MTNEEMTSRSIRFPIVLLTAAHVKKVNVNDVCRKALTAATVYRISDTEKIDIERALMKSEVPDSLVRKLKKLLEVMK